MRATSSGTSDKLVGEIVELSASAPAISGDYVRADGQVLSKAEWPLMANEPDVAVSTIVDAEANSTLGGGPGACDGNSTSQVIVTQDGSFVAIGYGTYVSGATIYTHSLWKSVDGISWKQVRYWENGSIDSYSKLMVVNNILFFCSLSEGLLRSNDNGDTWTAVIGIPCSGIAYGAGKYVLCSGSTAGWTSTDLVTWSPTTFYSGQTPYNVFYVGSKFFAYSGGSAACNSDDGVTWNLVSLPASVGGNSAKMVNGVVILIHMSPASTAGFQYSSDGITFTGSTSFASTASRFVDVVYDGTYYWFSMQGGSGTGNFLRRLSTLSGAATVVDISGSYSGDTQQFIAYTSGKCLVLSHCDSAGQNNFSYLGSAFPTATVSMTGNSAIYPLPSCGITKETLSGRKYHVTKSQRPSYTSYLSVYLGDANGYLTPVKGSGATYWDWSSEYDSQNVACFDVATGNWTMIIGHVGSSLWNYTAYLYSGTTYVRHQTVVNSVTLGQTSVYETVYGLVVLQTSTSASCYFVAKNQVATITTGVTDGYTYGTFYVSYDGCIVLSNKGTNFNLSASFDGGKTWPYLNKAPKFTNAAGATVTIAQFAVVRVNGVFYAQMSSALYRCNLRAPTDFRLMPAPESGGGYSFSGGTFYEYAPNRVVGLVECVSFNGSTVNMSQSMVGGISYSLTSPHRIGEWLLFGAVQDTSMVKKTRRVKLGYSPVTHTSAPIIRPTNIGKVPYVKGR